MACPATHCASAAATATVEAKVFILKIASRNRSKVDGAEMLLSSSLFNTAGYQDQHNLQARTTLLYLSPTPQPHRHSTTASLPRTAFTSHPHPPKGASPPRRHHLPPPHSPPQYQHPIIPPAIPLRYQDCNRQRDAHASLQLAESRRGREPSSTTTANSALHREPPNRRPNPSNDTQLATPSASTVMP